MAEGGNLGRGVLKVQVAEKITAKGLHDLLDKVLKLHGCTACGLVGIDLHLRGDDFASLSQLKEVQGVLNAEFSR